MADNDRTVQELAADVAADVLKRLEAAPDVATKFSHAGPLDDNDDNEVEAEAARLLKRAGKFVVLYQGDAVAADNAPAMLRWFAEAPGASGATPV